MNSLEDLPTEIVEDVTNYSLAEIEYTINNLESIGYLTGIRHINDYSFLGATMRRVVRVRE
jgi:hypothetical protein